jgi:hypothetical protein
MSMRALPYVPAILLCGALLACGGKGGSDHVPGPPIPVPSFVCADSAPATDHVVMRCAQLVALDIWRIDVVVGVPTTPADINGFRFYIEFDPLQLAFVSGSAEEGNLLNRDGEPVLFAASIDPTDPGRLIVGINRTMGAVTSGIPGHDRIMSFCLRTLTGMPFGPLAPAFTSARADDASLQTIPEIVFDDTLRLSIE